MKECQDSRKFRKMEKTKQQQKIFIKWKQLKNKGKINQIRLLIKNTLNQMCSTWVSTNERVRLWDLSTFVTAGLLHCLVQPLFPGTVASKTSTLLPTHLSSWTMKFSTWLVFQVMRNRGPGRKWEEELKTVSLQTWYAKKGAQEVLRKVGLLYLHILFFSELNGIQSIFTTNFCFANQYFPVKNSSIWEIPGWNYLHWFSGKKDTLIISNSTHFLT